MLRKCRLKFTDVCMTGGIMRTPSHTILLYINDIPNCSDKLSFRIFADDTNIFASSSNAVELQSLINQELSKVKEWCDLNKLSINLTKTNYMIIKSPKRKTNIIWDVKLTNNDGSAYSLEKRNLHKIFGRTYRRYAIMETSGLLSMYSNF